jgi:hypothetical protein
VDQFQDDGQLDSVVGGGQAQQVELKAVAIEGARTSVCGGADHVAWLLQTSGG